MEFTLLQASAFMRNTDVITVHLKKSLEGDFLVWISGYGEKSFTTLPDAQMEFDRLADKYVREGYYLIPLH